MEPAVEKGDIVNLQPYHFYMKTTADESEDAFSGSTTPLEVERDDTVAAEVLGRSRKQYGTPKAKVEKYMDVLFAIPEKSPSETKPASKTGKPKELKRDNSKEHGA